MSGEIGQITDPSILEITEQLGEPDAIYRASSGKMLTRIIVGLIGLGFTLSMVLLFILGVIPLPGGRVFQIWTVLIFGGIGIPLASITSINFALAAKGMWVLVYPSGLFIRRKNEVLALPWDEIQIVQFENVPDNVELELNYKVPDARTSYSAQERIDLVDTAYFPLKKGSTMGTSLTLLRSDAKGANVSNILIQFPKLAKTIQIETFRRLYPISIERLKNDGGVAFGPLIITMLGITHGAKFLSWSELNQVKRKQKLYTIIQKKKWGPWARILSVTIPNWHLFETLVKVLSEYHRVPDERDDYNDQPD